MLSTPGLRVHPVDVVIVGAGVIGSNIAYTLSRCSRLRIVLIDRGTPGCEASSAAAGVLAVASSRARRGVLLELRRRSAALYPDLVAALEDETGIGLGYRRAGLLSLACAEAEAEELRDLVCHRTAQGLRCEALDRAAVASFEPAVSPAVHGGVFFPDDASIDNVRLVAALVAAARQRGVELRSQTAVRAIAAEGATVQVRCDDEVFEAPVVVVAAGAWSAELLAGCGLKVPIRPARGEMLAVRPAGWTLRHIVSAGHGYLVPREGGEVLIGSTTAFDGLDKRVTSAGVAMLLAAAARVVPAVGDAAVLRTWAGLRPCSTIRRPIIARLPGCERVILAAGHHRNGILLAPITATLVAEMITGGSPSMPLRPFGYRRH